MLSREQRNPLSEWWWTVDRLQLGAIIALMLAGIILSLAASPPVATRIGLDPFHFFNRHVLFLLPSFVVMIGVSFLSPRQIRRTALIVFAVSIALIVATLLIGPEVKGSRRWITLLGVNIQASESAKPAFVVLAAWLFCGIGAAAGNAGDLDGAGAADDAGFAAGDGARFRPDHADPDGVGRAVLHRRHADDLGARARRRRRAPGCSRAYLLVPHVAGRIKRFMNPASGDTFQVDTAMEAFYNGGWFGLGPGEGIAKRSLPDSHTDFVFAVAAEEFGIILCLALLALFAFIVIRALSRAYAQRGHVRALRGLGACDPVRRAGRDQHVGQSAADPRQGHDAAVHLLWRLLDGLAGLRRRHDAGADAAAAAHRDGIDRRRQRGAQLRLIELRTSALSG